MNLDQIVQSISTVGKAIYNLNQTLSQITGAAGGDLAGTFPNPTIAKIQGTSITGTTGSGKVALLSSGSGISAVIVTAKLTGGGTNGSMTFTNGILTAHTDAT